MTGMGRSGGGILVSMLVVLAWGCRHDTAPPRSPRAALADRAPVVPSPPVEAPAAAPVAAPSAPAPKSDIESEEYFVYDDLIRSEYCGEDIDLIVVADRTAFGHDEAGALNDAVEQMRVMLPHPQPETIDDFARRNAERRPLRADRFFRPRPQPGSNDRIVLGPMVKMISEREQEELFKGHDGWKRFYAAYPRSQGIVDVSAVGFNGDRTQALLYVGNQSHWLAGAGFYMLLEKKGDKWEIVAKNMCWIS